MLGRFILAAVIAAVLSLSSLARGQFPGVSPEQMQEMMAMQQRAMQNMQAAGIDPMQYGMQMMQQMQDGTFDRAAMEQDLVDQGVIDDEMLDRINQMRASAGMDQPILRPRRAGASLGNLQEQLGASDEEWKVLEPKIQRLRTAAAAIGESSRSGAMGQVVGRHPSPESEVARAQAELQAALTNGSTPTAVINAKLKACREAIEKARAELAAARKDLLNFLSQRQEGVLVVLGMLD